MTDPKTDVTGVRMISRSFLF